ncbi:MAG: TatD family hydrolase [bacterium]|nr:TatD family hydrolase [bacterium]
MYIDTHSHLDKYSDELDQVIEEIQVNKIFTFAVSMDIPSYERNKKIAKRSDLIIPSFGIHPWEAPRYYNRLKSLNLLLSETPVIGEIGLDFHFIKDSSLHMKQYEVFDYCLHIAKAYKKVVNLHTKGAEAKVLERIKKYKLINPIIHWYSGPVNLIENYLEEGVYFSIGVELFFSNHIKEILKHIPIDRILTETDNPGAYRWLTGKTGFPPNIISIVEKIAEYKKISSVDFLIQIEKNFKQVFSTSEYILECYDNAKKLTSRCT